MSLNLEHDILEGESSFMVNSNNQEDLAVRMDLSNDGKKRHPISPVKTNAQKPYGSPSLRDKKKPR